jgi:hypothetical protein
MGFNPFTATPALALQASTGVAGFALQDATPTIISWTAPNDGNLHRVEIFASENVTSALTGGTISGSIVSPAGGSPAQPQVIAANQGTGNHVGTVTGGIVEPGSTVSVIQSSAVTVGAGTVWAEIWGY